MDISINRKPTMINADMVSTTPLAQAKQSAISGRDTSLSVTYADKATDEGIEDISISDSDITRTDPLGKMINLAFNLPAPAMPDFEK